jgi:hypothetical protein
MLWIFPEGRFGHRMAAIVPSGGALTAARACAGVPMLACGVDYTVFRGFRTHASVVLKGPVDAGLSRPDLAAVLEHARRAATDLSCRYLPQRAPVSFLHPGGWRAGHRARNTWFHRRPADVDEVGTPVVRV